MKRRMDRYREEEIDENLKKDIFKKNQDTVIDTSGNTRCQRNQKLYEKIYDEYGEFETLTIPSNEKAINLQDLKKEMTTRKDYRNYREYRDIIDSGHSPVIKKEISKEKKQPENEIYDIKELLNQALTTKKEEEKYTPSLTNEDYLKKLKLDSDKTNLEQVKEMYDEISSETDEEDAALIATASFSLDLLSDLKGDNDKTAVLPPIKDSEMPMVDKDDNFYSSSYKFSKKDFEDKTDFEDDSLKEKDSDNKKFFFKILLLIFGISLVVIVIIYLFNYFNRV